MNSDIEAASLSLTLAQILAAMKALFRTAPLHAVDTLLRLARFRARHSSAAECPVRNEPIVTHRRCLVHKCKSVSYRAARPESYLNSTASIRVQILLGSPVFKALLDHFAVWDEGMVST